MKKVYKKPVVLLDSFTLCTNIAAGCEKRTNLQTLYGYGCGYEYGRGKVVVFTSEYGCEVTEVEEGADGVSYNGVCYHVPNDANNLFNS